MGNDFVTIKTYNYAHEAFDDCMKLESVGVHCMLVDDLANALRPSWSIVYLRLRVNRKHVDIAEKLLCEATGEEVEPEKFTSVRRELDILLSKIG